MTNPDTKPTLEDKVRYLTEKVMGWVREEKCWRLPNGTWRGLYAFDLLTDANDWAMLVEAMYEGEHLNRWVTRLTYANDQWLREMIHVGGHLSHAADTPREAVVEAAYKAMLEQEKK